MLGGIAGLHQFALASHGFFAISIGVVEVRNVGCHTDEGCHYQYGACTEELRQRLVAPRLLEVRSYKEEDDEKEVVRHLYVVRRYLQGDEQGCDDASQQQLAPVGKYDTRYGWRHIGQCDELPDVPGGYQDEEVGRERPHDSSQCCQPGGYAECPQEDVEAEHQYEREVYIVGQKKLVDFLYPLQWLGGVVRRSYLVRRHAAEEGVGPTGTLARLFMILYSFLSGTRSGSGVVLEQNTVLYVCGEEVGKREQGKCQDGNEVGENLFHKIEDFMKLKVES